MQKFTFFSLHQRKCDKNGCSLISPLWKVFSCGHSFHVQCNLPDVSECQVCKRHLINMVEELSAKANSAVFNIDDDTGKEDEDTTHDESTGDIEDEIGEEADTFSDEDVEMQAVIRLTTEISS